MKLLAVDMDGTCLNSQKGISPNTLQALKLASENGILVVPTTGRALHWLPTGLRKWGGYSYAITSNGAKVHNLTNGSLIHDAAIDNATANALLQDCEGLGLGITAHIDNDYFLQGLLLMLIGRRSFPQDAAAFRYCRSLSARTKKQRCRVEEIQIFFMKPENRLKVEAILHRYPTLNAYYDGNSYVEILAEGVSKGTALTVLAEHLGIQKQDIACIGDNENDLSMFEAAGMRFAMGNAVASLKERADVILPGNDEDGVAFAVTEYILGNKTQ